MFYICFFIFTGSSDLKSKIEDIFVLSYKNSYIGKVQYLCTVSKNEITALVSEKNDFLTFSNNMKILLEDDSLRIKMGSSGYNHVAELFSYERLVKDVDELYRNLLNEKNL